MNDNPDTLSCFVDLCDPIGLANFSHLTKFTFSLCLSHLCHSLSPTDKTNMKAIFNPLPHDTAFCRTKDI